MDTTTSFVTMATGVIEVVKDGIELFGTAPLSYFVALAFVGAGVGIAKRLIPMKRAK